MRKFFTLLFMLLVSQIILGYDLQVDGIKYNIIGDTNDLSIVEVSFEGPITIPSTVTYKNKTYNVVKIDGSPFRNRKTTLTIGKNLKDIGDLSYSSITYFIVDEENETFSSEDGVLFNKDKSILIMYPSGNSVSSYTIPHSVKEIKDYSFSYCDLVDVTFGNSVKSIGAYAFADCDNLKNVILGDSVQNIGSRAFRYCDALEYFNFGKSLEKIPDDVCDYCVKLKKVEIPASVISINGNAFRECNALDSIILYGAIPPSIVGGMSNQGVLSSISRLATVIVPCGSLETYNNAPGWNNFLAIEESNISQYSFSVTSEDSNKGTVNIDKEPACGVNAEFVAIPNQGYQFQKWSDGNTENPRSLAVKEDVSLKAIFIAKEESDSTESTFVAKPFSISEDKTITFSPGNLQYHAVNDEWRFAPSQLDYIGEDNKNISPSYNGWIDLFGWGTGDNPTNSSIYDSDYQTFVDWGVNKIGNDAPNTWRTLTNDEWEYICFGRPNADQLMGIAQVDGVNGHILLPDNWTCPENIIFKPGFHEKNGAEYYSEYQVFTDTDWKKLESSGAIFLPAAYYRNGVTIGHVRRSGHYWSSTNYGSSSAYNTDFCSDKAHTYMYHNYRFIALSVRLVKDYFVQDETPIKYTLSFDANGGSGSMPTIEIGENESISIPTNTFNREDYKFTGWNTKADGTGTSYTAGTSVTITSNLTLYAQWKKIETQPTINANGHEYVDLGLPSGTLWATMNVGATSPEGYGDYFAWGETEPKDYYHWETYKLSANGNYYSMTKYCLSPSYGTVDNKNILELSDDAANANWGGDWRMPTIENFSELKTECTWSLVTKDGIRGFTVKGKNGNTIFLPEGGDYLGQDLSNVGSRGAYWSSNLGSHDAYSSCFYIGTSQEVKSSGYDRCRGYSVRPVLPKGIVIEPEKPDTPESSFVAKPFSISATETITFSPGNLQYHAVNDEWRFAPSQLDYIGEDNKNISPSYNGWIDLFGWGTGDNPTNSSIYDSDYQTFVDWGVNKIGDGAPATWRTLTEDEWYYLRHERPNANQLIGVAQINEVVGLIILPDNWICPDNFTFKPGFYNEWSIDGYKNYQSFNASDWAILESTGAVFLPAAGGRYGVELYHIQDLGCYWSATEYTGSSTASRLDFRSSEADMYYYGRYDGQSVRLVKDCNHQTDDENPEDDPIKPDNDTDISVNANGHEYVDLGLPSGTLWATCNVGADSPEDYGDYFAWGETEPKEIYNWSTYKWMTDGMSSSYGINKYTCDDGITSGVWYDNHGNFIGDNKTILELADDAANANWGGDWRMPTRKEQYELKNSSYTTWTWTTKNGVNGYKVTSKINGNSIFLPAGGFRSYSYFHDTGSYGFFWSSSLSTDCSYYSYYLYFTDDIHCNQSIHSDGKSVRPVLAKKEESIPTIIDETSALNIYAKEGTIYCDEEFKIYTISGLDITILNGSLQGIYVVKTEKGNKLICVR